MNTSSPEPAGAKSADRSVEVGLRELPKWLVGTVLGSIFLLAIGILGLLLLIINNSHLAGDQLVSATFDAIKIASGVVVSGGGVLALYLAVRRQRTSEADLRLRDRTQMHNEQVALDNRNHQQRLAVASEKEATQRQLTELYTRSVEQLGSSQAPVRLGAMYALERLADENENQRQTVVNLLASYLRMPFSMPSEERAQGTLDDAESFARQEIQVRNTAQRILQSHLRESDFGLSSSKPVSNPRYWGEGIDLDLSGATLVNLNLFFCNVRAANFRDCHFVGDALLGHSTFTGRVTFSGSTFSKELNFTRVKMTAHLIADFDQITVEGDANFTFGDWGAIVGLAQCNFKKDFRISNTKISGSAWFGGSQFKKTADLSFLEFGGLVTFKETRFKEGAQMRNAVFRYGADWTDAEFDKPPDFTSSVTAIEVKNGTQTTKYDNTWPEDWEVAQWPEYRKIPDESRTWGILRRKTE